MTLARAALARGFTLIELLIALAIFAFLAMLAAPMYSEMLANTEIRNAAENILMGVRSAQAEAVRSNHPARFVMDADGWNVYLTDEESLDFSSTSWRNYPFKAGASRASMSPSSGTVTFNGFGQIVPNSDSSPTMNQVDVTTTASISNKRNLRVLVGTKDKATAMKLCDPSYASDDPMGCP